MLTPCSFGTLTGVFKLGKAAFRTSHFALFMPVLVLLFFAGCVSTTDFDTTRNDLNQLKTDSAELKMLTSDLRKDVNVLREQGSTYAKAEAFSALQESQTSFYSQLSDISRELQILHGRFDENKFHIDNAMKDGATERELLRYQINSLDTRVKELNEKLLKLSEPATSQDKASPEIQEGKDKEITGQKKEPAETAEGRADENSPSGIFDTAHKLFKEKKYPEAREKFSGLIKKFPKNELAGDAQFQIAESYYAENDFEGAILAYETLIKSYPRSKKIPEALLKQGEAFIAIGDKKTAKVIYEKLIEQYPASMEAETAKKKIAELEKKPAKKADKKKPEKKAKTK